MTHRAPDHTTTRTEIPTMPAQEYLATLRRGWATILAVTLAGVAVAGIVALLTPPAYGSTVTFYISTAANTVSSTDAYQGSLLSQERVKSYTELLSSHRLGEGIVGDLGLDADPQDVADEISAAISPCAARRSSVMSPGWEVV